jgi:hypothetical protein
MRGSVGEARAHGSRAGESRRIHSVDDAAAYFARSARPAGSRIGLAPSECRQVALQLQSARLSDML